MHFLHFWCPWAPKWAPLGYPGDTILGQIREPGPVRVPKGVPGGPKSHFGMPLGRILEGIFDDFCMISWCMLGVISEHVPSWLLLGSPHFFILVRYFREEICITSAA